MKFPLKEIQSTWTQRPTASSSYPYVEIVLGDVAARRTMQLQLEQVGPAPSTHLVTRPLALLFHSPGQATGNTQPRAGSGLTQRCRSTGHQSGLPEAVAMGSRERPSLSAGQ